jgi:hypothetical protein
MPLQALDVSHKMVHFAGDMTKEWQAEPSQFC